MSRPLASCFLILNSFQDPSCPAARTEREERWTLKRVQGDGMGKGEDSGAGRILQESVQ